ncbi:hypothetical protein CAPTEDRAFT_229229 [Capitella teleta]|uniref:MAM domain-containing protein n=1 Tax=Capitella teleta TaxID=283909 RepID=R7TKT6_CAPTE|nr:hypothetical protein CAPTEDRAFT_229229 [Capitella teleta]|eukprot:ELT94423.1 hypothetical protein CAPTEDRAFT_229229 [Capitella teleta]
MADTMKLTLIFMTLFFGTISSQEYECTFEDEAGPLSWGCDFEQIGSDDEDWILHNGRTPSDNTGPKVDHTKGDETGKYMYVEASGVAPASDAIMVSPEITTLQRDAAYCLRFWYHMWGEDIGHLNISLLQQSAETLIWHNTIEPESKGVDAWQEAEVNLMGSGYAVRLVVLTSKGGSSTSEPYGDIAVDDLVISRGDCSGATEAPAPTTTVPSTAPSTVRTTVSNAPSSSAVPPQAIWFCDFDSTSPGSSPCDMVAPGSAEFSWEIRSGSTPTSETGPSGDKTGNGGNYLHFETSDVPQDAEVNIESPSLTTDQATCLTFWYHMYGIHVGRLSVVAHDESRGDVVWTKSENQGDEWHLAEVTLPAKSIYFALSAKKLAMASQPYADIALDDLVLTAGACGSSTAPTPKPPTAPSSTMGSPPVPAGQLDTLWGIGETVWLIILAMIGVFFIVLIVIIVSQACQIQIMRQASSSSDLSSVVAYPTDTNSSKKKGDNYIQAYDNLGVADDVHSNNLS